MMYMTFDECKLKENKRQELKFLSLKSSCSCEELILCGYESFREGWSYSCRREDFNAFQPPQHFVHLSVPRAPCSSSMSCSFHCHLSPGSSSSESSIFFQCCPTLPFPPALIIFLHSSTWLRSQRNKNHRRDMSDVWSHVSFLLFLPTHTVRVWSRVCSSWYYFCCNLTPWHSSFGYTLGTFILM